MNDIRSFCPNKKSKEFKELSDIFGEDKAYLLWMRNKGNEIDKAPNGALSKLFLDLLKYFKGNRTEAIKAKAKVYSNDFFDWFGKWTEENKENISKVVDDNGEPLIVWHGTKGRRFDKFNPNKIINGGGFWFSSNDYEAYYDGNKIPAFLNMRDPYNDIKLFNKKYGDDAYEKIMSYYRKFDDYEYKLLDWRATSEYTNLPRPEEPNKPNYPEKAFLEAYHISYGNELFLSETSDDPAYYRSRQTRLDWFENYGIDGEITGSYYVVVNSNQIKHAIYNSGIFSEQSDDIYYSIPSQTRQNIEDATNRLINMRLIYRLGGNYYTLNKTEDGLKLIDEVCNRFGIVCYRFPRKNETALYFSNNYNYTTDKLSVHDLMQSELTSSEAAISDIADKLCERFPQLSWGWIDPNNIPQNVRKDANAYVIGNKIYLVRGRVTGESAVEEFLHPLIYTIAWQNYPLYLLLLECAKRDFPLLHAKIKDTYTEEAGFDQQTREFELITQALSRYVHLGFKKGWDKHTVRGVVKTTFNIIGKFISSIVFRRNSDKIEIDVEKLPTMKLSDLANFVLAKDSQFKVYTTSEIQYNITTSQEKALKVADEITKRFGVLYKAYEKLPNKTPRKQQILNKIFETFNTLKRTLDYAAVSIALNYALDNIGTWDVNTNTPTNPDSIVGYLYRQSLLADPYSGVTPDILVDMYTNSIGFYDDLLSKYIPNNLDDMMTSEDRKIKTLLKTTLDEIVKPMWLRAMAVAGDKIVDLIIEQEVSKSDLEKEDMKTVAKDWLHKNIMYGDINTAIKYIFNYSYVKNPIIRQAFHLILEAETKTLEEIQPILRRILTRYKKAKREHRLSVANWQTVFMEFNRDGIPTGNFIRDINYGQYEEDLENFIKELNEVFKRDYGHTYVDDGNGTIINSVTGELAEDEDWDNGRPPYVDYMLSIEHWKCAHSNRRYTFNYYSERLSEPYKGSLDPYATNTNSYGHGLSPKTLFAYNHIQSNINYYLDLCTDPETGFSRPEKLSVQDKMKLDEWQKKLDDLSNPYEEDGTPKLDDKRQMAFEIRAWQKWLGDKLSTQIDLDAFDEEYNKVVQEAQNTNNPRLISDFFKYNSQLGINPDFLELTLGQFPSIQNGDVALHAELIRTSLHNLVKTQQGYTRDLRKMEDKPSFWLDCKRTDQIIEDNRQKQSKEFAEMFLKNFKFEEIIYRDERGFAIDSNGNLVKPEDEKMHNDLLTYQLYMINKYTGVAMASPTRTIPGLIDSNGNPIVFNGSANEVRNIIEKLFTYTRERVVSGQLVVERVPLSVFNMLKPIPDTFYNTRTNRVERTLLYVPKGRFAEKYDKNGDYINSDYVISDPNAEQPKRNIYDNSEAFNRVKNNRNTYYLYETLIDVMKEMLKHYLTTNRRFNYRLPQINAHTMLILSRITHQGVGNTLSALWESATTVEENDESMRTNEDYMTNPDGTIATDIPLKFVRKLKNPEMLTTDVVGSVILFANMALNYKNKQEIDSKLKTLRYNLDFQNRKDLYKLTKLEDDEEFAPNDDEQSREMYDAMLNKHAYGNQWTANPNLPKNTEGSTKTNAWRGIASAAIATGATGATLGGLVGLGLGMPWAGAAVGGIAGGVLGTLLGAIQSGVFLGVALFKTIKNMQRLETVQTLAVNIFSILVGFGDSMTRILKESIMGKYMSVRDIVTSFVEVIRYTPLCIMNIGNPLANCKLVRAMQLNGISKGVHQINEHINYGRFRRIASNLLMGGFSMVDWMANALLMRAFYNNVRFYKGLEDENGNVLVEKGFYSSYELRLAFIKAGRTKHEAKIAHMLCTRTLWGAYDNMMQVKPEYEPYVNQRIKTLMRSKTLKRSALYNGMNPDNDIPIWKQDIIGGIIGALRAWLAQAFLHQLAPGVDNIVKKYEQLYNEDVHGAKTKQNKKRKVIPKTNEERSRMFMWDYETGTPQDLIWIGITRSFKTLSNKLLRLAYLATFRSGKIKDKTSIKFSEVEKYAWTDALVYLGVLISMMIAWPHVHDWAFEIPKPDTRELAAPDSWWNPVDVYDYIKDVYIPNEYYRLSVDNLMFRTIESQITSIDPTSTFDLLNSVTALKNGISEHLGIIKPVMDVTGLSGHELSEEVKTGGYKFYSRGERSFYKFLGPLDNLHTFFDYYGISENLKFYTNMFGGFYRAFGYDFKGKDLQKSGKKGKKNKSNNGFGGFSSGKSSGFGGGGGFGGF